METIINQVGQKLKVTTYKERDYNRVGINGKDCYVSNHFEPIFEGSEFNPVLLADGTIIPYYKYDGQAIK